MKRYARSLCLTLLLAASLCVCARAEEAAPVPDPGAMEDPCQIFQLGAVSGPQTIPGAEVHAETWEDKLESQALAAWESGWEALRNVPITQETVYYLDVSALKIDYPLDGADDAARQSYEAFRTVMNRLVNDRPDELFYSAGWDLRSKDDSDPWYIDYDGARHCWKLKYVALKYQEFGGLTGGEVERRFKAAVDAALAEVEGVSEPLEKVLILHDYLVSHVNYNYEIAHKQPAPHVRIYGAYGALVEGNAVCNGYALGYQALLNQVKIKSFYVPSDYVDNTAHAWNLVELDGAYYHIDATWNDGAEGSSSHQYFLLSDETFKEIHKPYNSWSLPFPAADSKKYETGWFFNNTRSVLYRRQGRYYAVTSSGEVRSSDRLNSEGTNISGRDLHIHPSHGCVWDDGYLCYVYWDSVRWKTLTAFHLDSGHMIQADRFDSRDTSHIGLRREGGDLVLTDFEVKGRPVLASIPRFPSQTEAEPVVKGWNDRFPLYYHNGLFYAVNTWMDGDYTKKLTVTASTVLGAPGENPDALDRNLQLDPYHGAIWLGGYLYYMDWSYSGPETVMALQLDTGRILQLGQFEDPREKWCGLRYDGGTNRIAVYRGQEDLAGFPVLPPDAGPGITVFDGTALALVSPGQTLWTARYQDGRMLDVRQEDLVQPDTYWYFGTLQLDALAIPLSQDARRVRVFLIDNRWAPVCPAA